VWFQLRLHRAFSFEQCIPSTSFAVFSAASIAAFRCAVQRTTEQTTGESQRAMVAASIANMKRGGDRKSKNQNANWPNEFPLLKQRSN
jgi:hypothetical protein